MGGIISIQNTSQDDGWVSASGDRETMKTMVQTTDAEGGLEENTTLTSQ